MLTSAECLSIMKEKEEKKRRELEEKEKRKQERLLKKKLKEEEQKHKEAEKIRKAHEREERRKRMEAEKIRKATEKKNHKAKRVRNAESPPVPSTTDESSGAGNAQESQLREASMRPLRKRKKLNVDNVIFSDLCCVCFGSYEEDRGTGREWLECDCGRWIHEDCVVPNSSSSNKLCPLC